SAAQRASYSVVVQDHDDDNKSESDIRQIYAALKVPYLAFTTSSHTDDAPRWKVVIPLAAPCDAEQHGKISRGLAQSLGTDTAQARTQQGFYAPHKLIDDAPYSVINELDSYPPVDIEDKAHPFTVEVMAGWAELEAIEAEKEDDTAAQSAPTKTLKPSNTEGAGIIGKIAEYHSHDLRGVLQQRQYKGNVGKMLRPNSSSGAPAVRLFDEGTPEVRCYSHHGADDPLSALNHGGHALDLPAVICALDFNNDMTAMVKYYAPLVDADGQNQRQREYAKEQERIKAATEFENFSAATAKPEPAKKQQTEKADVLSPPSIAGDICRLIAARARRDRPELYPLAALHMLALVSSARPTVYTSKLNIITLGIASTAAGKETAQDVIKKLASECYLSGHIHSDMGSFREMIINLIDGDGKNLYIMDEVHSTLDSMRSKNAATYETKTEAEILKMTTTGLYTFRGAEKRSLVPFFEKDLAAVSNRLSEMPDGDTGDKFKMLTRTKAKLERQIKHIHEGWPDPFVSIMGHSVPEKLDKFASSADNIASGFIGRSLVVRCPEGAEPLRLDLDTAEANILQADISHRLARIKGSTSLITATDEADQYLRGRSRHFEEEEQRNCEYLGAIYRRASEHLFKVAGLLAIESGVINIEHARYADALVTSSIDDIGYLIKQAMAKGEGASKTAVQQAAALKVLKQASPRSGATLTALKKAVTRSNEWQEVQSKHKGGDLFDDLIAELIQKERLEFIDDGRRKRYRAK
ncbi:MAG TPA: hypothetical protein VFD11_03460, partial [Thiopseudomonas sp.]|nr:hypothetical protein [Thiopseudomonas sp.]